MNPKDYYTNGFTCVPSEYFDDGWMGVLDEKAKDVLLALYKHAGTKETCNPSIQRLAQMTGLSERSVIRAHQDLSHYNIVTQVFQGNHRTSTSIYRINHPSLWEKKDHPIKKGVQPVMSINKDDSLVTSDTPGKKGCPASPKKGVQPVTQIIKENNKKKKNPPSTSDLLDLGEAKNLIAQNMARMWNDYKPVGWVECPADGRQLFIKIEALYPSVPHPVMLKGQLHHVLIYINDADGLRNETKDFGFLWNADRFRTFEALGKSRKEILELTYQLNKNVYSYIKLENLLKDRLKDFKTPLTPGGDRTINVNLLELVEDSKPIGFHDNEDVNEIFWFDVANSGLCYSLFMPRTRAAEILKAKAEAKKALQAEAQKASPHLLTKN